MKKQPRIFNVYPKTTIGVVVLSLIVLFDGLLTIPYDNYQAKLAQNNRKLLRSIQIKHPVYNHTLKNSFTILDPGSPGRAEPVDIFTNSLGFRDKAIREVDLESSNHRILFMGDSITEGVLVDYTDTFVGRIDSDLARNKIEVLNAGVTWYSPIIYWRKIKYLIEDVKLKFAEVVVYISMSDAYDETHSYDLSDDMAVIERRYQNAFAVPVPISRFNMLDIQETLNKNLASVKGVGGSKTPSFETKGSFHHWNPSNDKSSQKITMAKNISLSKGHLEILKGIQVDYKSTTPNNPMQFSLELHMSGMKFNIPIEHVKDKTNLNSLTESPSETIHFASPYLQKNFIYQAKRILGLPFDKDWHFSQVGKRTLLQRRFQKSLNDVKTINFVFNPEFDDLIYWNRHLIRSALDKTKKFSGSSAIYGEEIELAISCNLRFSKGRFSENIIIEHGKLPTKFFKSSGHWVYQIDLEEYLHTNSELVLEEILLFVPKKINEVIAGRVVDSLIFEKQGKRSNSPNISTGMNINEYTQSQRIFTAMDQPKKMNAEVGEERRRIFLNLSNLKDVIKNRNNRDLFSNKKIVIEKIFLITEPKKPAYKSTFFISEPNIVFRSDPQTMKCQFDGTHLKEINAKIKPERRFKDFIVRHTTLIPHSLNLLYDLIFPLNRKQDEWETAVTNDSENWATDMRNCNKYGTNGLVLMKKYMDKLLKLLRDNQIGLTIAIYPIPAQVWGEDLDSIQVKEWEKWGSENNVKVINYFPDFVKKGISNLKKHEILKKYYLHADPHFNEEGHKVLAQKFLEYYKVENQLK